MKFKPWIGLISLVGGIFIAAYLISNATIFVPIFAISIGIMIAIGMALLMYSET